MGNAHAMKEMLPMFLHTLRVIHDQEEARATETAAAGTSDARAASAAAAAAAGARGPLDGHVLLMCLTKAAYAACEVMPYHQRCVRLFLPTMGDADYQYGEQGWRAVGFAKVKAILDLVTYNYDVLFLDSDTLLFKDPLPYIITDKADIRVSLGDCTLVDDQQEIQGMGMQNNIGVLYLRSTPGTVRFMSNWWMQMWRESTENFGWDQGMANTNLLASANANLFKILPLSAEHFPHRCMSACGCAYGDVAATVAAPDYNPMHGAKGQQVPWQDNGTYACPQDMVHKWHLFHFPCSGALDSKTDFMRQYAQLYFNVTGVKVLSDELLRPRNTSLPAT